jgi:dTDP-4-amino-4,6-dideoxygalactose transaminase
MYERADTPVAHDISLRGINLPSYTDLCEDDVRQICQSVRRVLAELDVL